ncbi:unnamed protein product [Mycena citricolor]|uniref:Uncharacterized protein n=1 Tax=Mycena citricolor TaxID=2018698 RepID=A0AAD2HKU1_9AGAR|nr:unnamed protein product [Mycena citricolor]
MKARPSNRRRVRRSSTPHDVRAEFSPSEFPQDLTKANMRCFLRSAGLASSQRRSKSSFARCCTAWMESTRCAESVSDFISSRWNIMSCTASSASIRMLCSIDP